MIRKWTVRRIVDAMKAQGCFQRSPTGSIARDDLRIPEKEAGAGGVVGLMVMAFRVLTGFNLKKE